MGFFNLFRTQELPDNPPLKLTFTLTFRRVVLFDQITEFSPIRLNPGDSLTVRWDVAMEASVNDTVTDQLDWKSEETFHCTQAQAMRFARYTYLNGKSVVRVYEDLPELLELPER